MSTLLFGSVEGKHKIKKKKWFWEFELSTREQVQEYFKEQCFYYNMNFCLGVTCMAFSMLSPINFQFIFFLGPTMIFSTLSLIFLQNMLYAKRSYVEHFMRAKK